MSRTSRLFALVETLRARRTPITADRLALELGISPRTVYRDIETLRSLGAPVAGQAGVGFRLGKGFFLPEFGFSADEMDAVTLGLDWVRQRADPVLALAGERVLAKILSASRDDVPAAHEPPVLVTAASRTARTDPPQVAQLRDAIRGRRKVAINYEDGRGTRSERVIWPIAVVYFDDVRVLAAWCERRSGFRHFRVDRMDVRTTLEDRYPERRHALMARWRREDRDWRSMLTGSDAPVG